MEKCQALFLLRSPTLEAWFYVIVHRHVTYQRKKKEENWIRYLQWLATIRPENRRTRGYTRNYTDKLLLHDCEIWSIQSNHQLSYYKRQIPFHCAAQQQEEENGKNQAHEISYQNLSKVMVSLSAYIEEHTSIWRAAVSKS